MGKALCLEVDYLDPRSRTDCMTLGKSLSLSQPQLSHL